MIQRKAAFVKKGGFFVTDNERYWKQLDDIARANESRYRRLVTENEALQAELKELKNQYPEFPFADHTKWRNWIDAETKRWARNPHQYIHRETQLRTDIHELAKRYKIPKDWEGYLFEMVVLVKPLLSGPLISFGFPEGRYTDDNSELRHELIITPEVPINNPIIQDYIKGSLSQPLDKPPKPMPMKDNPRKLDWRPVYEWKKRHPGVTDEQIAEMLGYNRVTVTRKLSEFSDKEN